MNARTWPAAGTRPMPALVAESLRDARPVSYWLDQPGAPVPRPALRGAGQDMRLSAFRFPFCL